MHNLNSYCEWPSGTGQHRQSSDGRDCVIGIEVFPYEVGNSYIVDPSVRYQDCRLVNGYTVE